MKPRPRPTPRARTDSRGGRGRPRAAAAAFAGSAAPTPFAAVADPTRRAILDGLRASPQGRTVNQIAAGFGISRPAISRHLRVLRGAALVRERKEGRRRIYTLDPRPLAQIDQWLAAYRVHWAATLIDLKEFLESDQE